MSYYELVSAFPESSASASRLALRARQLGYAGIIICNRDPARIFMQEAAHMIKGIDVVVGAEAGCEEAGAANRAAGRSGGCRALKSRIGSLRSKYPFLMVRGYSDEAVRTAAEDPNVDMLIHPCEGRRPLTIATARASRQNSLAVGFDLSPMMLMRGSPRARWMESLRHNLDLARKFHLSIMITAGASSHLDLRSPRDLMAMAEIAGFEAGEAEQALSLPGRLVELNCRKWAGPGVEIL